MGGNDNSLRACAHTNISFKIVFAKLIHRTRNSGQCGAELWFAKPCVLESISMQKRRRAKWRACWCVCWLILGFHCQHPWMYSEMNPRRAYVWTSKVWELCWAMLGQTYYINIHCFQILYGWAYVRNGPVKIPKVTCEIVGTQRRCAHQPLGDS